MKGAAICGLRIVVWRHVSLQNFIALADAVEWVASHRGAQGIAHYLDDYIMWGAPLSRDCAESLRILLEMCSELDIPAASQKCQGPTICLVFLGIEFDTMSMELRLPKEKLEHLQALITSCRGRKSCQRHELESLPGRALASWLNGMAFRF